MHFQILRKIKQEEGGKIKQSEMDKALCDYKKSHFKLKWLSKKVSL
jgi:hypothetical protein